MMKIIMERLNNPAPYPFHLHHIVPRCWYRKHGYGEYVQNAPSNLVRLTVSEHIMVHELMSDCMKDPEICRWMALASYNLKHSFWEETTMKDWVSEDVALYWNEHFGGKHK